MEQSFKHPQIFSDVLSFCQSYYPMMQNFPKPFRMSIGQNILDELAACLREIVLANSVDKHSTSGREAGAQYVAAVRSHIEVIRGFLLLAWKLKILSHGGFAELTPKLEGISRQAVRWGQWFKVEAV